MHSEEVAAAAAAAAAVLGPEIHIHEQQWFVGETVLRLLLP
jgi:hypothetical protein